MVLQAPRSFKRSAKKWNVCESGRILCSRRRSEFLDEGLRHSRPFSGPTDGAEEPEWLGCAKRRLDTTAWRPVSAWLSFRAEVVNDGLAWGEGLALRRPSLLPSWEAAVSSEVAQKPKGRQCRPFP